MIFYEREPELSGSFFLQSYAENIQYFCGQDSLVLTQKIIFSIQKNC